MIAIFTYDSGTYDFYFKKTRVENMRNRTFN